MKNTFISTTLCCLLIVSALLSSCGTSSSNQYNTLVEAYTSGIISRKTAVQIVLAHDVPQDKQADYPASKMVKRSPSLPSSSMGDFQFIDSHTIVCNATLERNQQYNVEVNLSKWFDVEDNDKSFSFSFQTLPMAMSANLVS
ncbi:MAG: hypothetical protein Q4C30_06400, partial [Bacteroidia bacterium]|nr:hypothetical protein [Bacteroidia bacterium]